MFTFNINITGSDQETVAKLNKIMTTLEKAAEVLEEGLAIAKAQKTAIESLDALVQDQFDKLIAAQKEAGASDKVLEIANNFKAVVIENSDLIVAAANVNTPDQTSADVALAGETATPPVVNE